MRTYTHIGALAHAHKHTHTPSPTHNTEVKEEVSLLVSRRQNSSGIFDILGHTLTRGTTLPQTRKIAHTHVGESGQIGTMSRPQDFCI